MCKTVSQIYQRIYDTYNQHHTMQAVRRVPTHSPDQSVSEEWSLNNQLNSFMHLASLVALEENGEHSNGRHRHHCHRRQEDLGKSGILHYLMKRRGSIQSSVLFLVLYELEHLEVGIDLDKVLSVHRDRWLCGL